MIDVEIPLTCRMSKNLRENN